MTIDLPLHRPRLERASAYAVGPGPMNPFCSDPQRGAQIPADPEPDPANNPLDALDALFDTLREECKTALRGGDLLARAPLGHGDLDWLNRELERIKCLKTL